MLRTILAVIVSAIAFTAMAVVPLKSATWAGPSVSCTTGDQLMPLDNSGNWHTQLAPPGAGVWPAGYNLTVRKICVTHRGSFSGDSYALSGHSGPNGDHVSPYVVGTGTQCMNYEADAPVVVTGGEYFDVHAMCNSGWHSVVLQIWYTQP